MKSYNDLEGETTNGYLKSIFKQDFQEEKYPFAKDTNMIMLLSTNGAAYTAKLSDSSFSLDKDKRMLISFFVKTSAVIKGRTGATITLVDGENKTTISAFDSTTVSTVDINDDKKDIYDGWVQCFFFVQNETDERKTFSLEFNLGPTAIASSKKYSYGQGYAAFANFEQKELNKTEYSYASTGDKAKKVNLTKFVEDTTVFDTATASSDIEQDFGAPVNFWGIRAGSKWMDSESEIENEINSSKIGMGLLNYKNVANYKANGILGDTVANLMSDSDNEKAWIGAFGGGSGTALQPLAIINKTGEKQPSYGYRSRTAATVSASSYQKISLRVKLSAHATANIYLIDIDNSDFGTNNRYLAPNAPKVTYWYDEDGNICKSDPTEKGFNKNTGTLFELQKNGLYRKVNSDDTTYYANLKNYNEKDGNLVTKTETVAFYGNEGNFYAYRRDDGNGGYTYDGLVKDLYDNGAKEFARYDYTSTQFPESQITVDNSAGETATDWITVTFYVHTGSEAKNYRLEVWAGDRKNATDGIPENGYVFFDRYSSTSVSNYDDLLKKAVFDLEDDEDMTLKENGNLPEELNGEKLAYYYTFTFYDSANYLRYDVNEDTEGTGNPYASYDQSSYSEELIYLAYNDLDGERTGTPSVSRFINYAASDVTVTPDSPAEEDPEEEEDDEENSVSTGDILLICSSALLGVVLIFVIVVLLWRKFAPKRTKKTRAKPVKDNRYKPEEKANDEAEEENPFVKNRKEKEAAEKADDDKDE